MDDDEGFDHPEDVPTTDMDNAEINSADDAVEDEAHKQRLLDAAEELKEKDRAAEEAEAEGKTLVDVGESDEPNEPSEATKTVLERMKGDEDADKEDLAKEFRQPEEGTNVDADPEDTPNADDADGDDADGTDDEPDTTADDEDEIGQAGSIFTDDEAEDIEESMGDSFELKPVEDIPDDFDYESQDTSEFGGHDEVTIEHNGIYFELVQPTGVREDKFWSEIQEQRSLAEMFDAMIRYSVSRPEDIEERMEEENWTSFAKAGLATKCSQFLGLDALQDF